MVARRPMQIFSLIDKEARIEQNRNRKSDKDFFFFKNVSLLLDSWCSFRLPPCYLWVDIIINAFWSNPNQRKAPQKEPIRALRLGFGLPFLKLTHWDPG